MRRRAPRNVPIDAAPTQAKNLFTGWADVPLTTLGKNEAAAGATWIWKEGLTFDVAYTSELKRAQQTLGIVQTITSQEDLTVHKSWRLNERMRAAAPLLGARRGGAVGGARAGTAPCRASTRRRPS